MLLVHWRSRTHATIKAPLLIRFQTSPNNYAERGWKVELSKSASPRFPHGYRHWSRHQVVHTVGEKLQKAERSSHPPLRAKASKLHYQSCQAHDIESHTYMGAFALIVSLMEATKRQPPTPQQLRCNPPLLIDTPPHLSTIARHKLPSQANKPRMGAFSCQAPRLVRYAHAH